MKHYLIADLISNLFIFIFIQLLFDNMFPVVLSNNSWNAAVFGGGKVAERRVMKLLDAGMNIEVFSKRFSAGLTKVSNSNLKLVTIDLNKTVIDYKKFDIIFIATDDRTLNNKLESESKKECKLVNRVDKIVDFMVPATIEMDNIKISISTTGKSPAMAKEIKKRLKKLLTEEDLLSIELQEFTRYKLKEKVKNQKMRRAFIKEIMTDIEVKYLISKGDLKKAKKVIRRAVNAYGKH